MGYEGRKIVKIGLNDCLSFAFPQSQIFFE
jgi:hypothetical protein